jgi:hypothetical protein
MQYARRPRIKKGAARSVLRIFAHSLKDTHFKSVSEDLFTLLCFPSHTEPSSMRLKSHSSVQESAPVCPVEENSDSLPANSMEQRNSGESTSCSATQEVPHIVCNVKVIVHMYFPFRVNLSALHILQMQ